MKTDRLDLIYTVIIITLIAVSTGHVGQLFADRETERAQVLGYVMALALDGVLVVSLHQVARSAGARKVAPLIVFLLACAVSGGFNYQYYRQNYPLDSEWVSAALGISPPLLGALMSVLRALRVSASEETEWQAQETELQAERAHQLAMEKLHIAGETEVQIAVGTAKEASKQANAAVRLAKVQEAQRQAREAKVQQEEAQRRQMASLGVYRATLDYYRENPLADRAMAAQALNVSKRTVGNHLAHLEGLGVIRRNGDGVEVLALIEQKE
jgi:DNA-binding transcriptional ArsR family regulator